MGMMRQLLMGGGSGERTLVSTTEPHTSTTGMPAMVMKVGASYSVSWAGTIPSASASGVYLFEILGGYNSLKNMCYSKLQKSGATIKLSIELLGTSIVDSMKVSKGDDITLELRFKVNAVADTSPYSTLSVELYINGGQVVASQSIPGSVDVGYGLRYYRNSTGTFIVKRLS